MFTPSFIFTIIIFAFFLYTCTLVYRLNNIKSTSRQRKVLAMGLAVLVSLFGYFQEKMAIGTETTLWAVRCRYIGYLWFSFFALILMTDFCNIRLKKVIKIIISTVTMLVTTAIFFDSAYPYIFIHSSKLEEEFTKYSFGNIGYVMEVYIVLLLIAAVITSIVAHKKYRASGAVIFFTCICLATVPTGILYEMGITQDVNVAIVLMIFAVQYAFSTNKYYHFLDNGVIAQHLILNEVGDGYVVLDVKHRVMSYNQIALMLYPELADENERDMMAELMYLNNHDCLEHNGKRCDIIVSELKEYGDVTGYVVWLYDRTDEYNSIDELNLLTAKVKEAEKTRDLYNKHMSSGMDSPIGVVKSRSLAVYNDENASEDVREMSSEVLQAGIKIEDMTKVLSQYSLQRKPEGWPPSEYYDTEDLIKYVVTEVESRKGGRLEKTRVSVSGTLPTRWYGSLEAIKHIFGSVLRLSSMTSIPTSLDVDVFMEARYAEAILVLSIYLGDMGSLTDEFKRISAMQARGDNKISSQVSFLPYDLIMKALGEIKGSMDWEIIGNDSKILLSFPQRVIGEAFFDTSSVEGVFNKNAGSMEDSIQALAKKLEIIEDYANAKNTASENFSESSLASDGSESSKETINNQSSIKELDGDKPVILVCDDNTLYLREMDSWLRKMGVRTIITKSGYEAIEVYRKKHIDLVFMDHMMPQMDGTQTLEEIRNIEQEAGKGIRVPVVLLTADDTVGARKKYLDRGFDEYISKPVEPHEVESIVKVFLPEIGAEA